MAPTVTLLYRKTRPMSQLEIRFFGECQFIDDGQRISGLQTKRMRSLLGYLVLHAGQQISATHLAFLFWPDSSEKQARTNLRRAFYNLRQTFPQSDEYLERGDHTVRWRGDGAFSLDVAEFETSIVQARTLLQQTGHDAAIRHHLEAAIARYRGDLLPDCYDDWIAPLRERLRQDYLYAIEQLMELCEADGDYAAAIRHGEVLLREDPLRERSYHRLMQLYMLNGDRPGALGVYHTCASELERELGVEPQASLTALYKLLLEQDDSVEAAPPRSPHQAAAGRLVGRKQERKQLFAAWRKAATGQARVALIRGEAGIGKTRLAEELFHWANQLGITAVRTRVYAASSNLAYAPIVEWLRSEPLAPRLRAVDHTRLAELARLAPEILTFHEDLPSPEPLAEDWQRTRLFEALAHTVCGDRQPLLLWIDDLQWCDSESLAWFQYLMRFDPGAPLLIVGTARDEELAPDHPLTLLEHQLRRDDQLTAINLKRLSDDEMVELGRLVARDHLDEQELKLQSGRAGGNPLFMVEMTRASLEAMPTGSTSSPGAGDERPAHDAPDERVDAFDLPPKVYSIIQARLAQLSPPARELLGLAAAIGRSFTFDLLTHASEMPESRLVQSWTSFGGDASSTRARPGRAIMPTTLVTIGSVMSPTPRSP